MMDKIEYRPTTVVRDQLMTIQKVLENHFDFKESELILDTNERRKGFANIKLFNEHNMEIVDQNYYSVYLCFDSFHVYNEDTQTLIPEKPSIRDFSCFCYDKTSGRTLDRKTKKWKQCVLELAKPLLSNYPDGIDLDYFISLHEKELMEADITYKRLKYTLKRLKEDFLDYETQGDYEKITLREK